MAKSDLSAGCIKFPKHAIRKEVLQAADVTACFNNNEVNPDEKDC